MSTLVDHQIRYYAKTRGMVEPFEPEQLNPASYDVTLGSKIQVEGYGGFHEIDISDRTHYLLPGDFILAHTEELVRINTMTEAVFQLKSSRGREGYQHMLAGYIDPGFTGQVTLELKNVTSYQRLPIYKGLRIGQLRFATLANNPERPYFMTGRYNNDRGAQVSKG